MCLVCCALWNDVRVLGTIVNCKSPPVIACLSAEVAVSLWAAAKLDRTGHQDWEQAGWAGGAGSIRMIAAFRRGMPTARACASPWWWSCQAGAARRLQFWQFPVGSISEPKELLSLGTAECYELVCKLSHYHWFYYTFPFEVKPFFSMQNKKVWELIIQINVVFINPHKYLMK